MRSQIRQKISIVLTVAVVVILGGYVYFQTRNLIIGPQITVHDLKNGTTLNEDIILIEGEAKNISWLSINGKTSYTNEEGIFSKKYAPLRGLNIITIEAGDKYGKKESTEIQIFHTNDINNS